MKIALVNPRWSLGDSVFFGCPQPHLPLELGYARALLEADGHDVLLLDAHLFDLTLPEVRERLRAFAPALIVLTTAPGYLSWSCPPPELDVTLELATALEDLGTALVVIGPHGSTSPRRVLSELPAEVTILGEPEQVLAKLAAVPLRRWTSLSSVALRIGSRVQVEGFPYAVDMGALPPLRWPREMIERHRHQHRVDEAWPAGLGAEMESSRGCNNRCAFCARENYRNRYRRRTLEAVLQELDGLIEQGVEYVYFIDEIFMPWGELLAALAERAVAFGIQTRAELWDEAALEALGRAGCVSLATSLESFEDEGRAFLDMDQPLSTEELTLRLRLARRHVPHVRAGLLGARLDHAPQLEAWRARLQEWGISTTVPIPLFPYPGSPVYSRKWGPPDELAWERAQAFYRASNA